MKLKAPEYGDSLTWSEVQAATALVEWMADMYHTHRDAPIHQWAETYRRNHGSYEFRDRLAETATVIERVYRDRLSNRLTSGISFDFDVIPEVMELYLAHLVMVGATGFDHDLIPRYCDEVFREYAASQPEEPETTRP